MSGSNIEERWSVTVGETVQIIIANVLSAGLPDDRYRQQLLVLDVARELVADMDLSTIRRRAFVAEVTTFTGCYLHRFLPAAPWKMLGTEVQLMSSRADVVWENADTGKILLDEVKTGRTRVNHAVFKDQALRHLEGAVDMWGQRVVGVRLLWLGAPHSSQFYRPGSNRAVDLWNSGYAEIGRAVL